MAVIIVRTFIIYTGLMCAMRFMGKRQLGELEVSELVVAVLIADITAMPLQDIGIPLINGLVPLTILLCSEILVTGIATKSIRLRNFLFGQPSTLIRDGIILQQEMRNNRFTLDELQEELRSQGITDIRKVESAILETDGTLNVLLYPNDQPVTPTQLDISCPNKGIPIVLINEGRILSEELHRMGKSEEWLLQKLRKHHIQSPDQVYLYSIDAAGTEYFAKMENHK